MALRSEQSTPTLGARSAGTAVAIGLGAAVAVQARINGELAQRINDGVAAALVSFLGGLVLLVALAATRPRMRHGLGRVVAAVRDRQLRPHQLLGGICGAFLVFTQGVTVATIGVAVFTVAVVSGQTASGLLVDRAGVGPGESQPVSARRVAGVVIVLAAVALAVSDRFGAPQALWLALLPALGGVATAWQQAVNGLVGAAARDGGPVLAGMLPAALVNFSVGTVALALGAVVDIAMRGLPGPMPAQPWLYLGGVFGVLFIGAAAAIVPITGVLLLGVGTVAGQLVGALVLDVFLPTADARLTAAAVIGAALTLVAVTVIALPARHRAGAGKPKHG